MEPSRLAVLVLLVVGCAEPVEGEPYALLGQRVGERQALAISRADFEAREGRAYSYSWEQHRYGDDGQLAVTYVGVVEGEVRLRAYEEQAWPPRGVHRPAPRLRRRQLPARAHGRRAPVHERRSLTRGATHRA